MLTVPAVIGKLTDVEPAATVTLEGIVTAVGEAVIAIEAPLLGAGAESVIVQFDPADGLKDVGLQEMLLNCGV